MLGLPFVSSTICFWENVHNSAIAAKNGRTIALSQGGGLMISDDQGANWRFSDTAIGGLPVSGTFTKLYQVPGGQLIAIMKRLEESSAGLFSYVVRTYFVTSGDNGNTWSLAPFPVSFATFNASSRRYYGVNIENLHMGPGGELLAYGTTSGTNRPGFVLWSIGGAIFRQSGASWVQAHFGNGPVGKIASASGRDVRGNGKFYLSDDDGVTWTTHRALERDDPDVFDRYRLADIIQAGSRWIAIGSREIDRRPAKFLLISDDDGDTWGQIPFTTNQPNTFLSKLAVLESGRLIITGQNGAVFTSDFDLPLSAEEPEQEVREGNTESGPFSDPNKDGLRNIAAYAFGINPTLKPTDWIEGPTPTAGATAGGFTTYTVTIPSDADAGATFARILVGIAQ